MSPTSPLGPDDWARINVAFHDALEKPPGEREALVASRFGDRPDLSVEVLGLLAVHDRAESFLQPDTPDAGLDPLLGKRLGHYQVDTRLGTGGMGVVYRALDTRLGREVALKAIVPAFTDEPGRRARLEREARAMARLTHPGIATVYALEEIDGQMYLASELVPGETLRDILGRGPMQPARAAAIGAGVARALAAAHDRGIVHRDLKPENVIITPEGGARLLDFGIAQVGDDPSEASALTGGHLLGTPAYMSPEQVRAEPMDGRSDIFSLGAVLYEAVTGRQAFASGSGSATIARVLESDVPPMQTSDPTFGAIVRRCLAKRPADRFATATDLAAALETMGTSAAPPRRPVSWWWRFHQTAAATAYALLLIPLWLATAPPIRGGLVIFAVGAMAVVTAGTLRLHLVFAERELGPQLHGQRTRARPWIRLADVAFVAVLLLAAWPLVAADQALGVFLGAAAAVVLVVSLIVEPATSRAALD